MSDRADWRLGRARGPAAPSRAAGRRAAARPAVPTRTRPSAPSSTTRGASQPGDLFVARPGRHADGHDHVPAAVAAGAVAVIVERPMPGPAGARARRARRHGGPRRRGRVAGRRPLAAARHRGHHRHGRQDDDGLPDARRPRGRRAPRRPHRHHRRHRRRRRASATPPGRARPRPPSCRLTSPACWPPATTGRSSSRPPTASPSSASAGIAYDVAVLTNITSEHLEFHGTLEAYREAKRSLFARLARSDENPEKG